MPFALVHKDRVIQIESEKFDVFNALQWIEIKEGQTVRVGDLYSEDVFIDVTQTEEYKQDLVSLINKQLNEYILSRYDVGTLIFFVGLYIGPLSTEAIRADIEKLWDWGLTIMNYYYVAKEAVLSGTPLDKSNWNLSQFDLTDPMISLPELLKG